MHDAEHPRRRGRLGEPLLRATRPRRRLAVGEIHDPHPMPAGGEQGKRASTADLDIVGVGAHGDHVERHGQMRGGHAGFVAAMRKIGLIASNRIRSICSMPRAMFTIQ